MNAGFEQTDRLGQTSPEPQAAALPVGLIDFIVEITAGATSEAGEGRRRQEPSRLEPFLDARRTAESLSIWLDMPPAQIAALGKRRLAQRLGRDMARLDRLLSDQVNAVLRHPRFQRLEASWRGLQYLVERDPGDANIKIRMLSVTWRELARDLENASEFDQSHLFRKIYGEEFGIAGGEPFGVLLGDYEIHPGPSSRHPQDDIGVLAGISHVAAAAFAPFIAAADPSMFGLDRFAGLGQPMNLSKGFEQLEFLRWRSFRDTEDARFVGLTMPRVLMRTPYGEDGARTDGSVRSNGFRFEEDVYGADTDRYLWGNAAYAFGGVLMRSFAESGWLADIRGVRRGIDGGGIVQGLPVHEFGTDAPGVAGKSQTDVVLTDFQEQELSELGFIPLCRCADTELSAFYANHSVQKPKAYDNPAATINARMSAMLQYMLSVSRFAHYLKVIARDKIGGFTDPGDCEDLLYRWLQNYVTPDANAGDAVKAESPLREAKVRIVEHPQRPGSFQCMVHLWPHFELDELTASVRITTELTPGAPG